MRACVHARACVFYSLIGGKLYYWGEGGGSYIVVGKAWGKFIGLGGGGGGGGISPWIYPGNVLQGSSLGANNICDLCNVHLQAA